MFQTLETGHRLDLAELRDRTANANVKLATTLEELAAQLGAEAIAESATDFPNLVDLSRSALGLDDLEMSRLLKVARPTIGRWIRGDATPHRIARKAICEMLARTAIAQARARRG